MSTPLWVVEAAEAFWQDAGVLDPFPRDLRRSIATALPVALVLLPRLRTAGVDGWLRAQGIACGMQVADRSLRACLIARRDQGLLFVDGTDPQDEQRFSVAHELAHFLRHYRYRRSRAAERLGPDILQVLDGDRVPRQHERAHAVLAGVQLGFHVHLMDRDPSGGIADPAVYAVEREADRLAYELLAPAERVLSELEPHPSGDQRRYATDILIEHYGFPAGPAQHYASCLVPETRRSDSFLHRLGVVR